MLPYVGFFTSTGPDTWCLFSKYNGAGHCSTWPDMGRLTIGHDLISWKNWSIKMVVTGQWSITLLLVWEGEGGGNVYNILPSNHYYFTSHYQLLGGRSRDPIRTKLLNSAQAKPSHNCLTILQIFFDTQNSNMKIGGNCTICVVPDFISQQGLKDHALRNFYFGGTHLGCS